MTATARTPVLIVGAGPAGLVTALGLARHGVRSMIVERHPSTSIYPRATGISLRSMEIFRALGVEDEIRAFSLDARPTMSIAETLSSPEHTEAPLGFPTAEQTAAISPTRPAISPQDHLEPVLLQRLKGLGMTDIRFDTELVALEQESSRIRATVVDTRTGGRTLVTSRYLVGADGGRSTVRDLLGIELEGEEDLEHYATILFRANLWPHLGDRRHGLYAVGPDRRSVVVPMGPDDRWMFATPVDRDTAEKVAADNAGQVSLVREAAGMPDLPVKVLASMPIAFVAQVATRWRDGRAFLIGDAAHRMPPFGGRGMNTAIADAHNLSWKLAWVLQDVAEPALLDSFEAERGPVGRRNVDLALARYRGQTAEASPDGLVEDIGYVYRSPMLAPDAGGRALHAWLRGEAGPISTIDLFGERLVLLTNGSGAQWRMAARSLRGMEHLLAGLAGLGPAIPVLPPPPVSVVAVGGALVDADGSFARSYELAAGGAVLVRPDGHIAARWPTPPVDCGEALAEAVSMVLGHPRPAPLRTGERDPGRVPEADPSPA
jgi:putative polyketide hydroxylase